ncbi:hypothetical protein COL922a_008369 [Colletotrichum nupharicola]|nr:hypothetical protein COL922a_008369 [Colletotrichum nupharicola]
MSVCNGQSPCPTLHAEEGDLVELTVKSDVYAQSSIHWSGIGHKGPYRLITNDEIELRKIMEAEKEAHHLAIKNHQHRDTGWKMLRMRAEGSEFYCYDSIIVNGKGRVHCRQPGFETLNGHNLDETGCIQPAGLPQETCTPSKADYEAYMMDLVIETEGRAYIMLNLINIGFEHSVMASIDSHKMIVVANNGGFVIPEETDVVYIPSAGRVTVLVKLDAKPGDYALRLSSTSQMQNLQGYSILRYPASRRPIYGEPMELPQPESLDDVCVLPDSSTKKHCKTTSGLFLPPYPALPPPKAKKSCPASADFTFHLAAGSQPSLTEPHVPEYFLNERPWQLFRSSLTPLLFHEFNSSSEASLGKPVIDGIPMGSVDHLIIENQLNDTIPLYKHADPAWLLVVSSNAKFPYTRIEEAVAADKDIASALNLEDPGLVTVHDLPPLAWSVLRFRVTTKAATMIHAVKLSYFALGMSAPIMEGILPNDPANYPTFAANQPHVDFEPKNDGVFG